MNTLSGNLDLDPFIMSGSNLSITPMGMPMVSVPDYDIQQPEMMLPEIIPSQQEMVNQNYISAPHNEYDQANQATNNSNRDAPTRTRFDTPDNRATDGIGRNNRLSSGTKKPSPMAAARTMDSKLKTRNNASPDWRRTYY